MPGDLGTVTVTLKNTASSASFTERTGPLSSDNAGTTTVTDINVYIEKALLEGNGIEVVGESYQRIGDIGPGQTIPITFLIRAPAKAGSISPRSGLTPGVAAAPGTRYR